jgi:hypothetical protein
MPLWIVRRITSTSTVKISNRAQECHIQLEYQDLFGLSRISDFNKDNWTSLTDYWAGIQSIKANSMPGKQWANLSFFIGAFRLWSLFALLV